MQQAYFLYITSMVIFGFNGILAYYIHLSSSAIVFWRIILGFSFLFLTLVAKGHSWQFKGAPRELIYLTLSGFCIGGSWLLLYASYNLVGVSIATLLYNCGPVIVILLGLIFYGEALTKRKIIGILGAGLGIMLLNYKAGGFAFQWLGLVFGLGSALFYAIMVLFNKKAQHITGCERSFWQLLTSLGVAIFFVNVKDISLMAMPVNELLLLLTLGIFNTGFACFLYFKAMEKLPMNSVAILGYLESVFAVLFAFLCLGEDLSVLKVLGLITICGGAIIAEGKK